MMVNEGFLVNQSANLIRVHQEAGEGGSFHIGAYPALSVWRYRVRLLKPNFTTLCLGDRLRRWSKSFRQGRKRGIHSAHH